MRAQGSDDTPLLYDYQRAAQKLSLSEQALRDLVWKNRGPVVTKIGRRRLFALSDLEDFVARHRRPPVPTESSPESFQRRRRVRPPTTDVQAFPDRRNSETEE